MKQQMEKRMVLCDEEAEYAQLMSEYLRKHGELPWSLSTYTSTQELLRQEKQGMDMLVVAENAYADSLSELQPHNLVVLNESGVMQWENVHYVDKYMQAEEVRKQLLAIYADGAGTQFPKIRTGMQTKFIGNYSPVRRCMQTSFALTLGQLLAAQHRTLYLNFEHYAGFGKCMPQSPVMDLADLLYFVNAETEKFRIRMQTMLQQMGEMDYIPPMKAGQNLLTVTEEEWLGLLQKISELEEYEYVILDLSESMQGLFEILRRCSRIFTSTARDATAERKLMQYEQVLSLYAYEDVLYKTDRLDLSFIRRLPAEPEQLTRSEMAEAVKSLAGELLHE